MIRTTRQMIRDDGVFPGNGNLELCLYEGVLSAPGAEEFEALFAKHGWPPAWHATVFDYHHYHSTAHEALGCFQGGARIQFGGPGGPVFEIMAGDAVMIPAGVAHCRVESSGGFTVVGAYPAGTSPDMNYGKPGERPKVDENIKRVKMPETGPVGPPSREGRGGMAAE